MADRLRHLQLARAEPINERRRRADQRPRWRPDDAAEYAKDLAEDLADHTEAPAAEIPGFDPRRLLKLEIDGLGSDELASIPEFAVVTEEGNNITVLFATDAAIGEFRRRLGLLEAGQRATREDILFAVKRFEYMTREDRLGPVFTADGFPEQSPFYADVELWPLELANERTSMGEYFEAACAQHGIEIADSVNNPALMMYRVRVTVENCEILLNMRDVRRLEQPPSYQFDLALLEASLDRLPEVQAPPDDAPTLAVLDSGLATAHPLIEAAVGDSQSFTDDDDPTDEIGHGTSVAGHALLGDVAAVAQMENYQAKIRLLSGKIAKQRIDKNLLENRIAEAVRYFKNTYDCRVFNLSIGDFSKPYRGGHVDRLGATIDWLSREYGVLFVISTGNIRSNVLGPDNWREAYPQYLLGEDFRILDPAPALNAITVGSLANYEVARMAARNPDDPAYQPIARRDQPSPFTLSGPGPNKSIKPDLVDYGGNGCIDTRQGTRPAAGQELGELSLSVDFAAGNIYRIANGTSYAAPRVAHIAARLAGEYPEASTNLIRALLLAHAKIPDASASALSLEKADLHHLIGFGRPNDEYSLYSEQNRVTMTAEGSLGADVHHFYEMPMPDDLFSSPCRRKRRITVAIAHTPKVRRTRLQYRESALSFRIVKAENLAAVTRAYRRLKKGEKEKSLPEASKFLPGPLLREGDTVQCASRTFSQIDQRLRAKPYFVVVTNSIPNWVPIPEPEPYALAVVIEDLSEVEVKLYAQVRLELQARVRAQARAQAQA